MLFGRKRQRKHDATTRLAGWALGQAQGNSELERLYGSEHAGELGPLGWVFRAVESEPVIEPTLGMWQRFETELRERLMLLPPPRRSFGAAGIVPFILFPGMDAQAMKAAVGDLVWKSAVAAAATATLTFHIFHSDALSDISIGSIDAHMPSIPTVHVTYEPTGNAVMDHLSRNFVATQPGTLNEATLARFDSTPREIPG